MAGKPSSDMRITIITLLICLFGCIHKTDAQKIRFSDTSNRWVENEYDADGHIYCPGPTDRYRTSDTVIAGSKYHILSYNIDPVAIREDTILNKVYFRFLTPQYAHEPTDTLEHVLYDYNLKLNDTFRVDVKSNHFAGAVYQVDSLLMGGYYYKVWYFNFIALTSTRQGHFGTFIEGIGSVQHPGWFALPYRFEGGRELSCFFNRGVHSICSRAVKLPYPPVASNCWLDSFNNSCPAVGVEHVLNNQALPVISPNPLVKESVLRLPYSILQGRLMIYDAQGRIIVADDFSNTKDLPVGTLAIRRGIYFFQVYDLERGQDFRGTFIVE